jgi:hypothetical protein
MQKLILAAAMIAALIVPTSADEVLNGLVEVSVYSKTCGEVFFEAASYKMMSDVLRTYPEAEIYSKFHEVNASVQQIGVIRYCAAMNENKKFQHIFAKLGITRAH